MWIQKINPAPIHRGEDCSRYHPNYPAVAGHLRRSVTGAPVPVIPGNSGSGLRIGHTKGSHRPLLADAAETRLASVSSLHILDILSQKRKMSILFLITTPDRSGFPGIIFCPPARLSNLLVPGQKEETSVPPPLCFFRSSTARANIPQEWCFSQNLPL